MRPRKLKLSSISFSLDVSDEINSEPGRRRDVAENPGSRFH